jgi:glycosyltransferase involved in cell wall biosynthesis
VPNTNLKLLLRPEYNSPDRGDGGIRRVVEAQRRHLPSFGVEFVDSVDAADVVAVHAGVWVNTLPDKPTVSHCHGLYWSDSEWDRWCHKLNRDVIAAARQADVVTAPSEWVAQALRRGLWASVPVLQHGIEPEEWPEPDSAEPHGGYVLWNKTRIDPACDPTPVFELAGRAKATTFVATIKQEEVMRRKLRYPDNVRIVDVQGYEESKALVRSAGVYLATTRETFGIGTLEAMASGVPVLGWAWGGQAEFVRHKETGWLSRPGDYDHLREGLEWLLAHRAQIGNAARQDVLSRFTWVQQVAHYFELYSALAFPPQSQAKLGVGGIGSVPKISVVIPCYNLGRYLPMAVESVVKQKGVNQDDVEVVILDDASTDNSRDVAQGLSETYSNVRAEANEVNLYLAGNLNRAIGMARGKYIVPLDADNMLGERALTLLSEALDADRGIDIAYGSVLFINEAGEPDESIGKAGLSGWPPPVFDFVGQHTFPRSYIPSTAMYRRQVWERVGGYRTRWRTAEDADFWCRATSVGAVPRKVTDAITLGYRNRPDSMSRVEEKKDWTLWYPWARDKGRLPWCAPLPAEVQLRVPPLVPVQVSVVIPVGPGHERLVVDAIDSIVAQTFENWEIVIVNDTGSALPWVPSFVRVLDTHGRHNPAAARNLGIAASTAPLFVLLDADDYLRPDTLGKLYETWRTHKGYIYTDWAVAENGKIMEAEEYDCKALLTHIPHTITALYARADWERVGGFDEALAGWEDWDFLLSLAAGGVCGLRYPEPLLTYRASAGKRRVALEAEKEKYKDEMFAKWGDYVTGRKPMACGGCGGRSLAKLPNPSVQGSTRNGGGGSSSTSSMSLTSGSVAVPLATDAVLLEYVGHAAAPLEYRGASTGTRYRFGSDAAHKRKYVYAADVPSLLTNDALKRVGASADVLV